MNHATLGLDFAKPQNLPSLFCFLFLQRWNPWSPDWVSALPLTAPMAHWARCTARRRKTPWEEAAVIAEFGPGYLECEYHGNQGIKSESSWEWDYTFGTLGAWEKVLCVSWPARRRWRRNPSPSPWRSSNKRGSWPSPRTSKLRRHGSGRRGSDGIFGAQGGPKNVVGKHQGLMV